MQFNLGRYCGERIDIHRVLAGIEGMAIRHHWIADPIPVSSEIILPAYRREPHVGGSLNHEGVGVDRARNIYISTGIHADEPAGPLTAARLMESEWWPAGLRIWLLPCLNPTGFPLCTRENAAGIDLNRDYRSLETPEVRAHVAWLQRQPRFDLALCIHEDWEAGGAYIYELNPDGRTSLAGTALNAISGVMPIETSSIIDGRESQEPGIIRPPIDPAERPQWPEAFYLFMNHTRFSYTLETSSDFPLGIRVEAQVRAVQAMLERFAVSG